jgi:photosystem II stability/assembly factor-like uncharacterized protein
MKRLFLLLLLVTGINCKLNARDFKEQEGDGVLSGPMARFNHFNGPRAYPFKEIPEDAYQNSILEKEKLKFKKAKYSSMIQAQQPEWKPIGPFNTGGRIKSIVIHPDNPDIVYIGAAAGGIWKTTDGGQNWKPIFDHQNSIAFGSLAIDEKNPNVIYAGTGEAVPGGGGIYLGSGMYKTTDAGETWKLIGLSNVGAFSKVYVHPLNSNLIYAGATSRGIGFYKSTDAGATWNQTLNASVTDVSIDPLNEKYVICGVNGVGFYTSNDAGETWQNKSSSLPINGYGRISIQMAPSFTKVMYLLSETSETGGSAVKISSLILRSNDSGISWYKVLDGGSSFFNGQGYYDNYLIINPQDADNVMAGGIDVFKSTNGSSFINVTNVYSGGTVHPDQQCAVFYKKDPKIIYYGNDGGIWKTTNGGDQIVKVSNGLDITQLYALSIDNTQENRNYGGSQDNGSLGNRDPLNWQLYLGGDGFQSVVDPFDPNIVIMESQYGNMARFDFTNGTKANGATSGLAPSNSTNAPFFAPIAVDPNPNRQGFYYHGRKGVFYNTDKCSSGWTQALKDRTAFCTSLGVSNFIKDEFFSLYAGFANGELFYTEDLETWTQVNTNGLPNRAISNVITSSNDKVTAYVVLSGYGTPHVYKTTNKGNTWTNIGQDLPNTPVNQIALNPNNELNIYVGTDIGVFTTYDGGASWLPFGSNLPNSPITDLQFRVYKGINPDPKLKKIFLRASTYGRSVWEVELPETNVATQEILIPFGGEQYIGQTNERIAWSGFELPVKVEYSSNNGDTWLELADNVNGNSMLMFVPNTNSFEMRIKISSKKKVDQVKISNTFAVTRKKKGSVTSTNTLSFTAYGISYDGNGFLWATDIGISGKLYKIDASTLQVVKSLDLAGDSLFTDICVDRTNGDFYTHRFTTLTEGSDGKLEIYDKTGKRLKSVKSPAGTYPIGVELVDGKLLVSNRDGNKKFTYLDKKTLTWVQDFDNSCNVNYGPRGLAYDGVEFLYHICTDFTGGSMSSAKIVKINKNNLTKAVDAMELDGSQGLINARGVDYDPTDKNFWVSDYGGNIYKIAGFETVTSVDESKSDFNNSDIEIKIAPNPMVNFASIAFEVKKDYSNVKIEIYDAIGKRVGILFDDRVNVSSPKNLVLNSEKYQNGLYNLVFIIDGQILETKKFIVNK